MTGSAPSDPAPVPADVLANPRLGSWISVTDDALIGVRVGKVELGQGILTPSPRSPPTRSASRSPGSGCSPPTPFSGPTRA